MFLEILKKIGLIFLGVVLTVGIFCLVVAIACACNGIGFNAQIVQWFGGSANVSTEAVSVVKNLIC